ncbi:MAG: hypothetical protein JWN25_2948 [Verrucomicrobiales bacterium]|nr:hypothetical protein [Verrucomicrobiales bacterium]
MKWWIGSLGLLLIGFVFKLGLLVYAIYILVGILLVSRYLSRTWINGAFSTRHCSHHTAELTQKVTVEVTITNQGSLTIPWLLCEDFLSSDGTDPNVRPFSIQGARMKLLSMKANKTATVRYTLTCLRRGYYQIGPMVLETGDLFGLHRRFRVSAEPDFLMVLPRVVLALNYDLASPRPMGEIRVTHRLYEDPTLITGIKSYEPGQPLNRIHWRATARTGQLQSKVFQPSRVAGATLLLDFNKPRYSGSGAAYREDLAIVVVASLAHAFFQMGQRFGLLTNGRDAAERIKTEGWQSSFKNRQLARAEAEKNTETKTIEPNHLGLGRGESHFGAVLELLARVELAEDFPLSHLIATFSNLISRNATVIAVISGVDEETSATLGELRQQGYMVVVVFVAFDEPQLNDWGEPPDWFLFLSRNGIPFYRVDDDKSLRELCSTLLVKI